MVMSDDSTWEEGIIARARDIVAAFPKEVKVPPSAELTAEQLAAMIDHTLLKPEATPDMIARLCEEARTYRFASVCVNPTHVAQCAAALQGSGVRVCTVAGFPLGATLADVKAYEARRAIESGAREVDMVINVSDAVQNRFDAVQADIKAVRDAIPGAVLKVIIESAALTDDQIVGVCEAAKAAGANFVKTSTGFHPAGGASVHAVALMKKTVGDQLEVKASGGIRDGKFASELLDAGATRLGLSSSQAVLDTL